MTISNHVLFISRVFPPQSGSAVQRPTKFAKYLECYGWVPHVVTCISGVEPQDPSLIDEIPSTITVHRVHSLEPDYLLARIQNRTKTGGTLSSLLRFLLRIYAAGYHRLAVPDGSVGWVPFSLKKAADILRSNPIDVIYIHGQPPSSFLVGWLLKNTTNIPLVMDYDDPWSTSSHYSPYSGYKKLINRFFEKRCLAVSDYVIVCKEMIGEQLSDQFSAAMPMRMRVIPNGYDEADFTSRELPQKRDKFQLIYTGKLDGKFCYSPLTFLRALSDLADTDAVDPDKFEVLLAGSLANDYRRMIRDLKLDRFIKYLGMLNHQDVTALLKSADALLLIIESTKGRRASEEFAGSVPAKIYEYLYLMKPILAIIPPGPERSLLQQCGAHYVAEPNDRVSVKKALSDILKMPREKKNRFTMSPDFIGRFDRRRLTGQLAAVFNELLGDAKYSDDAIGKTDKSSVSTGMLTKVSGKYR
jgi:glycosyltransferase involved in cell wall biosynthesis